MQPDFLNAHERHWQDAETLFSAGRLANADHLYGMSAECGLKRLMIVFGMAVNPTTGKPVESGDRQHANGIWARFESYRSGKTAGADYGLPTNNPFGDWNVSERYAHSALFDEPRVQAHKSGAKIVFDLIKKAEREGLLS